MMLFEFRTNFRSLFQQEEVSKRQVVKAEVSSARIRAPMYGLVPLLMLGSAVVIGCVYWYRYG